MSLRKVNFGILTTVHFSKTALVHWAIQRELGRGEFQCAVSLPLLQQPHSFQANLLPDFASALIPP